MAKLLLARGFNKWGDTKRANKLLVEAVEQCKEVFGERHEITLELMKDLSNGFKDLEQERKAVSGRQEVVQKR